MILTRTYPTTNASYLENSSATESTSSISIGSDDESPKAALIRSAASCVEPVDVPKKMPTTVYKDILEFKYVRYESLR